MLGVPMPDRNAVTPTREEDFPEWYQQVVKAADLAENSDVRGCMVIKPWGYAIWENIQRGWTGCSRPRAIENAYFPLFIPMSFLGEGGRARRGICQRMRRGDAPSAGAGTDGKLIPAGAVEEPLIVRPTSETIIGATFARWVQSYRDLPILINQWANVVRWELRTRLFLRTTEFLWQEGHTAHATEAEASEETMRMLERLCRLRAGLSGHAGDQRRKDGRRTISRRRADALHRGDGAGSKSDSGGHVAFSWAELLKSRRYSISVSERPAGVRLDNQLGESTRLIGTLIMAHGDDDGLVLPPRVAPAQAVVIPITPKEESRAKVLEAAQRIAASLRELRYHGDLINVELDQRDLGGGVKSWDWIKKGVPVRIEIGPRDLAQGMVALSRRDRPHKERSFLSAAELPRHIPSILDEIQAEMLARATAFRNSHTQIIESKAEFYEFFTPKNPEKPEIHGGFALAYWNGSAQLEEKSRIS